MLRLSLCFRELSYTGRERERETEIEIRQKQEQSESLKYGSVLSTEKFKEGKSRMFVYLL
jgi:hypothetical protein